MHAECRMSVRGHVCEKARDVVPLSWQIGRWASSNLFQCDESNTPHSLQACRVGRARGLPQPKIRFHKVPTKHIICHYS